MKAKYIEIENEKIYLKKSVLFGWSVVYPNINNDGSINWMNVIFGGKYNLIKLIFLVTLIFLLYLGANDLISAYKTIADNPCNFCSDCFIQTRNVLNNINRINYNFSNYNLSLGGV